MNFITYKLYLNESDFLNASVLNFELEQLKIGYK